MSNKQFSLDDLFDIIDNEESSYNETSLDNISDKNIEALETKNIILNESSQPNKLGDSKENVIIDLNDNNLSYKNALKNSNVEPSVQIDNNSLNTQLLHNINEQLAFISEILNDINISIKSQDDSYKKLIDEIKEIKNTIQEKGSG